MRKIKAGDEVVVILGKHKGACGKVLRVVAGGFRVIVEGINLMEKIVKQAGGKIDILEKEAPLHVSNVAIFNPDTQAADKIILKILPNGRKIRCFKSNGKLIDDDRENRERCW